jgi:hypothetical protein
MKKSMDYICKVNCPENMSYLYDTYAKFVVGLMYDKMNKYGINEEQRKELVVGIIEDLEERKRQKGMNQKSL